MEQGKQKGSEAGFVECACVVEAGQRVVTMSPDTPGDIPGNAQFAFTKRLPPSDHPLTLRIVWPDNGEFSAPGFDYPHNANFREVLPRIIYTSADGITWERLEAVRVIDAGVEIDLPARRHGGWISVGIPYFETQYNELVRKAAEDGVWQVTEIGHTREGRPLQGCYLSPGDAKDCRGVFFLQGYQHHSEWAAAIAMDGLVRKLTELPGHGLFAWAVVPCLNRDALARGWRGDPMHTGEFRDRACGGNLNRDWGSFHHPETRASAGFFRAMARRHRPLHALDAHMGWSRPEKSGGGLAVFREGELPADLANEEKAFSKTFFAHVPIEPFHWAHQQVDRPSFAAWAYREFQRPGHTWEISRFQAFDAEGEPHPPSWEYYHSLGPAVARALIDFYSRK